MPFLELIVIVLHVSLNCFYKSSLHRCLNVLLLQLEYDILQYIVIERLAQGGREKVKDDGLNLSDWLQCLASFWGHLYVVLTPACDHIIFTQNMIFRGLPSVLPLRTPAIILCIILSSPLICLLILTSRLQKCTIKYHHLPRLQILVIIC